MVEGFLNGRGWVSSDGRTEPLIVIDISENIEAMKNLIGMTNSYYVLFPKPFLQVSAF
jgi:type II secretory pathway component HofQ